MGITNISLCDTEMGAGSDFGEDWFAGTWMPVMEDYNAYMGYLLEYWWAAAFFGWTGWVLVIVNVLFMLDFQGYQYVLIARALGEEVPEFAHILFAPPGGDNAEGEGEEDADE